MIMNFNNELLRMVNPLRAGLIVLFLSACQTAAVANGCTVQGPVALMPEQVRSVRLGMTQVELEAVMREADYSPIDGVFYFSTGGDCPLEDSDRVVSCGLVAEFRDYGKDDTLTDSLQSCWWGGIGE
ncbi:MAG: hypothetical protein NVV73_01330 [Cellvibrionaceae bacterium]|nr:hypothetical protein [Cellvibrionaceae bacterium]